MNNGPSQQQPNGGGGGRNGAPPPPPPPGSRGGKGGGKGKGGKGKGGGGGGVRRNYRINLALSNLQNALIEKGFDANQAFRFARMALTQKGVEIGRNGQVHYKGSLYKAADFVNNPLIQYVTGAKAKAENEAALKADPNYQMALAQLGLARDQSQSALDAQKRQALIDFGDPSFVQGDPALAAAAGANPFGTAQTLLRNYGADQRQIAQQSNDLGTNFGGGQQSGMLEAQHQFAGQQSNATSALQNLLDSITMQGSQYSQNYDLGAKNALLQTQQNLQAQGLLSAHGPKMKFGTYHLFTGRPPRPPRTRQPRPPRTDQGLGGGMGGPGANPGLRGY